MYRYRLLTLLLSVIPLYDVGIPEELYWECQAEGIDPDFIYDCICNGDEETLNELLASFKSEDLYDVEEAEDLFRLEVLQDLESKGIEYMDGKFFIQAETHNSEYL